MKRGTITLLVVLGIVAIVVLGIVGFVQRTYNGLVQSDEQVKASWAQVQTVLQRRADLIPNLVETVRGYQIHEQEVLIRVTEARARVAGAGTIPEQIQANQELGSALSRLLVVVENYPNLKANENFIRLQDELAGTENRIAVERRRYNEDVRDYNVKVRRFPANLVASSFGFERATPFEAAPGAETAPKVDFGTKSGQ
ncbi:MAG: LemA family protein [Candidatus Eisenbacteria bacterium]|nr:LemA family protein [Candidatus Eisenbacteria bacterium]